MKVAVHGAGNGAAWLSSVLTVRLVHRILDWFNGRQL